MYKKILVPLDPAHPEKHDHSVAVAKALQSDGAEITVVAVIEVIPAYVANELPEDVRHAASDRASKILQEVKDRHGLAEGVLLHGHAGNEIVDHANSKGFDCVVISSHKPDLTDYLLGSTASRVVRHAKCTVHVMR